MSHNLLSLYKLFGFKFATNKSVDDNLTTFKRLVQDHNSKSKTNALIFGYVGEKIQKKKKSEGLFMNKTPTP